jgi:RNA recognition motif-containing protein
MGFVTKLRVMNLSRTIDREGLERLFSPYGTVHGAEVVTEPQSGTSTGVGVVEMESDAQAEAAVAGLHHSQHCGRVLTVGWSTAAEETASGHPRMYTPMNIPADAPPNRGGGAGATSADKWPVFIQTLEVKTDEVGALGSDAATVDATAGDTERRP